MRLLDEGELLKPKPPLPPLDEDTPEADWLTEWKQGQTAEIATLKTGYETELATDADVTAWENLARSNRWLTPEEYQGVVATRSYETARTQEIADWYKEQVAVLETQGEELEGVQQIQTNIDQQSDLLGVSFEALNTELQKPTSIDTVKAKADDFIRQVEPQIASLTAYRDWLRTQGTTPEDEIAQAKAQGLPEEQWVSTDDRIRDLESLIQWARDVQTQMDKKARGPALAPWKWGSFWGDRVLGFATDTVLQGTLGAVGWLDTSWSVLAAQTMQGATELLTFDNTYPLSLRGQRSTDGKSFLEDLINLPTDMIPFKLRFGDSYILGKSTAYTSADIMSHPFWSSQAHKDFKEDTLLDSQEVLAIVNPIWLIPPIWPVKIGATVLKGLGIVARGGEIGEVVASRLVARLALRGAEMEKIAAEAGMEARGFKNVLQITGRTPGLAEHYLPQITRVTQVGVRAIYLPVEAVARITLEAIHIAGALGKGILAMGWKLATLPFKTAGWVFSRSIWRPAMSQLGKLAVPESMKVLAANTGFEVSFATRAEQLGKGMLFRVKNKAAGLDVFVKNEDEFIHLANTGELMSVESERYFVEKSGQVLTYKQITEAPVQGTIWKESAFRLITKPEGMSTEVWSRGFQAFRVDSLKKMVEPVQMMDQFPTIEKFMETAPAETPLRRAMASMANKEWAQGHMRGVPGLRQLIMSLDPVASEIARAAQAWRNMQEALEMWKVGQLSAARRCAEFDVQVVTRSVGGETLTELIVKNVQARDNKAIAYIGDVLEHPERFVMSDELRLARDIYCKIIDEAMVGLKKFGVDVKTLGFEEGGHYFPRYVLGKNGELVSASGPRVGGGFMTKASFQKTRMFDEMAEGIQKGYIYEGNPLVVLDAHVSAACKRMADQEFYRIMKPRGLTEVEIVEHLAPGLRKAAELQRETIRQLERIDKEVKLMSAIEPHGTPKGATMRRIRKYNPEVWAELKTVRAQATAEEKALRSTLQQYADAIWFHKEMKLQSLTLFPTEKKLRDIMALLPDEMKAEWKQPLEQLYNDSIRVSEELQGRLEAAIEALRDGTVDGTVTLRLQAEVVNLTKEVQLANEASERLAVVRRVFREDEQELARAIQAAQRPSEYAKPVEAVAPKPEVPEIKLPTQETGIPEVGAALPEKPVSPTGEIPEMGTQVPKPVEPTATRVDFTARPESPEVKPTKEWWDRVRLMSENRLKDVKLRQARMEADLAAARARAKHPNPFGGGELFEGEKGKMVSGTFAFQGTWFPESVATAIEKQLGDQGARWLRGVSGVSGAARMLMTGLDFGAGMIQGLPVLLMRPDVWIDAQKKALEVWKNPKAAYEYLNMPSSREVIRETIMAGKPIIVNVSEFTETMGAGGMLGKLVSAPGLKQTARPAFERAALSFDTFGTVARIEMYKGLRPLAKSPEDLLDLIDFINKMTGTRSGVVAGATQRQIEGSLLLFAPRYFRASVSLMFDVFRGGLKGTLARRMFASMLAGGTLFYYGVCKAIGQEPNFDPRSSKFLTIELGGSHIGFGSIWVALARMFAGIIATASDKPGDLLKFSRDDNPTAKFMAGRLAPLTGSAMDIVLGKTYIGENLESKDGFLGKDWAAIGKEVIARNLMPFWIDAQLSENPRPGLASIPAEMLGFRSWALQPWEQRNKLRDFYAMEEFGVTWEQLRLEKPKNNEKAAMAATWGVDAQRYLENSHGDLVSVTSQARQAALKRGGEFDALYEEWSGQFVTENERVAALTQRAADEFKYNIGLRDRLNAGDTTLTADEQIKANTAGQIFRETTGKIMDNHRYWRESIQTDTKYKDVYDQLDKWKEEGAKSLEKQGLTEYVGDRAYQAYISLMYETTGLEDQFGKFDYDEQERRKQEWLSTWGYDMWDYCQKRLSAGKEEPAIVTELRKARQILKPYWEMQDKITQRLQGRYPQSAEEKQGMVRTELTNRLNAISANMGDLYAKDPDMLGSIWRTKGGKMWKGIIAKVRAQVNSDIMILDTAVQRARDQIRRDNPDIDFYLRLFYDRKTLDTPESTSFLHMANPYGQSTETQPSYMPLALSSAL